MRSFPTTHEGKSHKFVPPATTAVSGAGIMKADIGAAAANSAFVRVLPIRPTRSEGPEFPVPPFAHRAEKVRREPRFARCCTAHERLVFCRVFSKWVLAKNYLGLCRPEGARAFHPIAQCTARFHLRVGHLAPKGSSCRCDRKTMPRLCVRSADQ